MFDEVVVSTELMTNIEAIDPGSGVAVCQVLILITHVLSIIVKLRLGLRLRLRLSDSGSVTVTQSLG